MLLLAMYHYDKETFEYSYTNLLTLVSNLCFPLVVASYLLAVPDDCVFFKAAGLPSTLSDGCVLLVTASFRVDSGCVPVADCLLVGGVSDAEGGCFGCVLLLLVDAFCDDWFVCWTTAVPCC